MDDIIINKVATIEKCIKRIQEESDKEWKENFTVQDALILNIERACQPAMDLAAHVIRIEKLGIPKYSRELFDLLFQHKIIPQDLSEKLKRMVGFRNLAVHDYGNLSLEIVQSIIENDLVVFNSFCGIMMKYHPMTRPIWIPIN